jgi:2-dehydropantoate 2-reductase
MEKTPVDPELIRSWTPRRIGIVGAGAMGTSLASILGSTVPVVMVERNPDRAAQILRDGVRTTGLIESASEPIVVRRISDLARIGGISALFVATKTTAIPSVAQELGPIMDEIADQPAGMLCVSYQNGIEPGRQLMEMLGSPRVLRMVLNFGAMIDSSTGVVRIGLNQPPHAIGSLNESMRPAAERIADLLTAAGLETEFDENIESLVWQKGIVNAAANPVTALVNSTVGETMHSPAGLIVRKLLREGKQVAEAEGIELGDDFEASALALLEAAGKHTPSMVEDIRSGRESEIGQLNRQILEHAKRLGVEVPTHTIIDALIETFDWKVYQRTHAGRKARGEATTPDIKIGKVNEPRP